MEEPGDSEGPLTTVVDGSSLYLGMVDEDIEWECASGEGENEDA